MKPRANYKSQIHGQLKVLDAIEESNGRNNGGLWRCLCSCGQFINVRGYNLHSRTSCGCLGKKAAIQRGIGNRKPEQEKAVTKAYQQYKRKTMEPLVLNVWKNAASGKCHYCKRTVQMVTQIDIINKENLPVCDTCSAMRGYMNHNEFVSCIKQIHKNLSK